MVDITAMTTKSNKPLGLRARINRMNRGLSLLTVNRYFEHLPMCDIGKLAEGLGFNTDDMDGIYCGHEGRATIDLGELVRETVRRERGVELAYEVEFVGHWPATEEGT